MDASRGKDGAVASRTYQLSNPGAMKAPRIHEDSDLTGPAPPIPRRTQPERRSTFRPCPKAALYLARLRRERFAACFLTTDFLSFLALSFGSMAGSLVSLA